MRKQTTLFPDVPRDDQMVDPETGRLKAQWYLYFQNLSLTLQSNYQTEGVKAPSQTTTDISNIKNKQNVIGNIVYDTVANTWKGIIQVTPGTPTTPPVTMVKTFTVT